MLSLAMVFLAFLMSGLLQNRAPLLPWVNAMRRGLLFWSVGIQGLLTAYGHTGLAAQTAAALGWPPGTPFQYELGMAHLALGFLGISGEWFPSFRAPTALAYSVFAIGCGSGFLARMLHGMSTSLGTAVNVWISDCAVPLALLMLSAAIWRSGQADLSA